MDPKTTDQKPVAKVAPHFPYARTYKGNLVWGVFIVFVGVVFLLNNLNLLPWSVWNGIGRFWPLILIVAGIDTLIGQSWISRLVTLLVSSAFFATVIGVVLLRTSPELLSGVSPQILSFLNLINSYVR